MKYKLFSLEYLINEELTEDDLFLLFETSSLNYSLIVAMHRLCDMYTSETKIIKDIKKDNSWVEMHHFKSIKERKCFVDNIAKVAKNVYSYSDYIAKRWAEDWMLYYGFSIKQKKKLF